MTAADRLRLFREYVRDLASGLASGDHPHADRLLDLCERSWDAADEDGQRAMRWATAALMAIEEGYLVPGKPVPAPPWLEEGATADSCRGALAAFFAVTDPVHPPPAPPPA